jgi:5-methylcytosine-specific restriction endonuclease McrA
MEHQIDETELLSKKITKAKFRKSIIEEWDSCCYVCGKHFDKITLDHLVPKRAGGHTTRFNLAPCCSVHNRSKGSSELWSWWTQHPEWNLERAVKLLHYLRRADSLPLVDDNTP